MANYNYKMSAVIGDEEFDVKDVKDAIKQGRKKLAVGEVMDVWKECNEKHRRNPGQNILVNTYIKIVVRKVCLGCTAILSSKSRVVPFTNSLRFAEGIVEHEVPVDDKCPNPYCNDYYIKKLGDEWSDADELMPHKMSGYGFWLGHRLEDLYRTSEYPVLKHLKFSEQYENYEPFFIEDHLPFETYMWRWWNHRVNSDDKVLTPEDLYGLLSEDELTDIQRQELDWWRPMETALYEREQAEERHEETRKQMVLAECGFDDEIEFEVYDEKELDWKAKLAKEDHEFVSVDPEE